jgi:hypothetical protein
MTHPTAFREVGPEGIGGHPLLFAGKTSSVKSPVRAIDIAKTSAEDASPL